ncbi:MAG: nucleotidyl transferase [Candidatus Latescibacteria bacterium]|nr:nucleotidyl transferase [Candidatus Latescibacterota bacterium]
MPDLSDIQVVILAGGLGTRLRPLTEKIPKVLAPVLGRPFIHFQLEYLRRAGFRKVLLLIAYLGEQIEDACGDGSRWGLRIDYAREPSPMGTGGALKLAEGRLEDPFALINGDTFLPLDFSGLLNAFFAVPCSGMMTVYADGQDAPRNNVRIGPDGFISAYDKRNPDGLNGVDAGVSIYRREVLKAAPAGRPFSFEEELLPGLIERRGLRGFRTRERFYDMGTPETLRKTEDFLRRELTNDHF